MTVPFFASHSLLIRDREVPALEFPVPPDPEQPPLPVDEEAMAFSAIALPQVYLPVGSAASVTMATVTCADTGITLRTNIPVPGMTFSYSSGVATMAGTPTAQTDNRIQIYYMASDGSGRIRGATEHRIVTYQPSEMLDIGDMSNPTGRVGEYLDAVLCAPSIAADCVVTHTNIWQTPPGCQHEWTWTRGATSSGQLRIFGTPTMASSFGALHHYYRNGVFMGESTHTVYVVETFNRDHDPVPDNPGPTPSTPLPPDAPDTLPVGNEGPDPYIGRVRLLMHCDSLGGLTKDETDVQVVRNTGVVLTESAYSQAALLAGAQTFLYTDLPANAAMPTDFTIECMVEPDSACLLSLSSGVSQKFSPVISMVRGGKLYWSLGLLAYMANDGSGSLLRRVVGAFIFKHNDDDIGHTYVTTLSNDRSVPDGGFQRLVHLAGSRREFTDGSDPLMLSAAWLDGVSGDVDTYTLANSDDAQRTRTIAGITGTLRVGGLVAFDSTASPPLGQSTTIIPFGGVVDEIRLTAQDRYGSYMSDSTNATIPAVARRVPWRYR